MTGRWKDSKKKPVIPPPLQIGDTIAVVAPCSPPSMEYLEKGVRFLRSLKLNVVYGNNISKRSGYLAGTDDERASDLNDAFVNEEVRGVFLARGGYGCMRIIDRLDLEGLSRDPKILFGMSDATAIQLFIYKELGLVSFSGPMVAGQLGRGLDPWSEESYIQSLFVRQGGGWASCERQGRIKVIRHGSAKGPLLGGCISIVSELLGTPYMPALSGAILLLEDVNEPMYRLDRMFTQLRLAGIYDRISGIVLGHFIGSDGSDLSDHVEDLVLEMTKQFEFPVVSRFPHGHGLPNVTLPHGMTAILDTSVPSLSFAP